MFNLELSITTWRNEMSGARISPDALDELESHLRDDITQQIRSGQDARLAFDAAIERLGCPSALQKEFKKLRSLFHVTARAKNAIFSFAGIPNHHLLMNGQPLNLDSRWTTYLRSVVFLAPALCLWILASIFVTPQLNLIWMKSGGQVSDLNSLGNLLHLNLSFMNLFKDNLLYFFAFAIVALVFLENRSRRWPRYRRAVIGSGVFLLNFIVLLSFAILFLAATVAANQFLCHAKP